MPHNTSQWLAHRIAGGWATDYGNTFYGAPDGGNLEIPWCTTCENVKFKTNGNFGKYPGLALVNESPIKAPPSLGLTNESSHVKRVYNYTRMGTTLTGTSALVAIVGSHLYKCSSAENQKIGDITTSSQSQHYLSTFNDLLIIGGLTPYSWDQTTFQALAGAPPAFEFSTPHAGRHWATGSSANPSRLYYSVVGSPEDWVGSGSGSIDIDPGDGDGIVALLSWKRELWVFKGPNQLSIHRISGTTPSDFVRVPFVHGISAGGQGSLFTMGDDFGFWSPRGSCHSLASTDRYGDYSQAYVNYPLLSWFRNPQNLVGGAAASTWQTVTDTAQNITYCVLNNNAAFVNPFDLAFMMDWRFRTDANPYPRFIRLNLNRTFSALGLAYNTFNPDQLTPVFGDLTGRLYQERTEDLATFTVSGQDTTSAESIRYRVETPAITYGSSVIQKTMVGVSIDIRDDFTPLSGQYGELDFSYSGRGVPAQTLTFTNTLGGKLGSFVLGTDQLGGSHDRFVYADDVAGETKALVYTLIEDTPLTLGVGTNVVVDHFSVLITPSGESMENN